MSMTPDDETIPTVRAARRTPQAEPARQISAGVVVAAAGGVALLLLVGIAVAGVFVLSFFLSNVSITPVARSDGKKFDQHPKPAGDPLPKQVVDPKPGLPIDLKPIADPKSTPKEEPDDEPAGPKLEADPQREPLGPLAEANGKIPLADSQSIPVCYSWGSGPLVAVIAHRENRYAWDVWNLRTMKKLGSVPGSSGADVMISPDGTYCAMGHYAPGSVTSTEVNIFNVADGKPLHRFEVRDGKTSEIGIADFSGPHYFFAVQARNRGGEVKVWDVKTGAVLRTFKTVGMVDRRWAALSPGGRYLAIYDTFGPKHSINVYEVATGEMVRTLSAKLPASQFYVIRGLAFAWDGKELALLVSGEDKVDRLQAWDFETGRRSADHKFTPALDQQGSNTAHYYRPLQWLPDRSGWCVNGQLLLDHKSGHVFWKLDVDKRTGFQRERRFLDATHYSTVMPGEGTPMQLEIVTLPREALEAARMK